MGCCATVVQQGQLSHTVVSGKTFSVVRCFSGGRTRSKRPILPSRFTPRQPPTRRGPAVMEKWRLKVAGRKRFPLKPIEISGGGHYEPRSGVGQKIRRIEQKYLLDPNDYEQGQYGPIRRLDLRIMDEMTTSPVNADKIWYMFRRYREVTPIHKLNRAIISRVMDVMADAQPAVDMRPRLDSILGTIYTMSTRTTLAHTSQPSSHLNSSTFTLSAPILSASHTSFNNTLTYPDIKSIIRNYGQSAITLQEIHDLFDQLASQYNIRVGVGEVEDLFKILAKNLKYDLVLGLFSQLPFRNIYPSLAIYETVLRVVSTQSTVELAMSLIDQAIVRRFQLTEHIIYSALVAIQRHKQRSEQIAFVNKIREHMVLHKVQMTHLLYFQLHGIYQNTMQMNELDALNELYNSQSEASHKWWKSALVENAKTGDMITVDAFYREASLKNALFDSSTYDTIIKAFVKLEDGAKANLYHMRMRFEKVYTKESTYFCLLEFFLKRKNEGRCVSLKTQAVRRRMHISEDYYVYAISCLLQSGRVTIAREHLRELWRTNIRPTSKIYNLFIAAYLEQKRFNVPKALIYLSEMIELGVRLDAGTYYAFMHRFWKQRSLEDALNLVNLLDRKGIPLNTIVYNNIMRLQYHVNGVEAAEKIYSEMVRRQIPMDQDSFAYLIEVYMGEDMPLRALEFWNGIYHSNLVPTNDAAISIIQYICKAKDTRLWKKEWARIIDSGVRLESNACNLCIEALIALDMPKLIFPVMELIFPKFDASPDIHVFQDLHVYLEDGGHDVIWSNITAFWSKRNNRFSKQINGLPYELTPSELQSQADRAGMLKTTRAFVQRRKQRIDNHNLFQLRKHQIPLSYYEQILDSHLDDILRVLSSDREDILTDVLRIEHYPKAIPFDDEIRSCKDRIPHSLDKLHTTPSYTTFEE
ncbi:hypothetical protein BASA82_001155 [Batrachochytrium salamandrivorans]|nr:hypothetical protein BASA82_001155 [Batrachochytrium salamandrivorans]